MTTEHGPGVGAVAAGLMAVCVLAVAFGAVAAITRPATPSAPTLSDAAAGGDLEVARSLLEAGADPDEPVVNGFTPLMRATLVDDAAMARLLLDHGAEPERTDISGLTVAHLAAEIDAADVLPVLVDAGADLDTTSTNGMNTLQHAAAGGAVEVLDLLAAAGADLDAVSDTTTGGHGYPVDDGPTALAIAARNGHVDTVRRLLDLGAAVDARSARGQTALLAAVFAGQGAELVGVLLDAGADPSVRAACISGCSEPEGDAVDWARRLGHSDLVATLEAAST